MRLLLPLIAAACALLAGLGWLADTARAAPAGTTHYPDLQTIIPTNSFSIVGSGGEREFRYTHLVYNEGPGPLAIQPQYHQASGNYHGVQQLYTHDAGGNWSHVENKRLADHFFWHAIHGHFHFPLAAFGLYEVTQDNGIGAPVAISPKNGFCIDDSYIHDSNVPHSGVSFHARGGCGDPSTVRGVSVGGADEYDYRDPGQAIPIDGVPDGTYWFRAMSDPNNDLAELDESNNGTNVKVTISNGQVTPGQVVFPDTTPPPISLTAPAEGAHVNGTVTLSADTPLTFGTVEFLIDGNPIGSSSQNASPYAFNWDTTTAVDGEHWLSARTTDPDGRTNTSEVVSVTVENEVPPPPEPGELAIDGMVNQDGRNAQTTPPLSTTHSGDMLLAFVASDGPASTGSQTVGVSGGGLSWSLVRRANTRYGTSEIWKAFAFGPLNNATITSTQASPGFDQSLTVIAFTSSAGVGASIAAGAATGAPSTSVTTTVDESWVFGVGNDWDRAVARTLGANQILHHQWVDTVVGDTFWVQSRDNPTPTAGTVVPINDTAPTNDQWNLAAVEVLPAAPSPGGDTTPPQVTLTDPPEDSDVSGIVTLGAVASDSVGVESVQFKIDGQPLGTPVESPPFMTQWDTRLTADGQHTITAEASDAAGNVGTSQSVVVNVDNSAPPPKVIQIEKKVITRRSGTLRSPALTTKMSNDQIVAFVALDGPDAPRSQEATVSSRGLNWSLVKRSNTQAGDAEIWTSRARGKLRNEVITAKPLVKGYDGQLTVVAFRSASGTGVAAASAAPSGPPDIYLPGVGYGSWVFGVGTDYDGAVARQPVAGQVLQSQWLDVKAASTFWVQSTAAPNAGPGLVTLHDNAPTTNRWNYCALEVTPAPGD